jgi:MYXO-CTERM domain-containing protein
MRCAIFSLAGAGLLLAAPALAVDADPSTYTSVLPTLMPGDTLNLAAGDYTDGLNLTGLNGSDGAWITITGPTSGPPAVFLGNGCCNTVEITDSSYLAIQNITVDGQGIDGVFGVSAKGGSGNVVHHIAIEGCTFVGQNASQQTVGISTKTPTWGWLIRGNVIDGAGTGLYLGNSTHDEPFIQGVIEHNLVRNTIGYGMQIKAQNAWPAHPGIPAGPTRTIIRHNVFIKDDTPSPDGARPNLLVGGSVDSGAGSDSSTEIYGNLFVHNSNESLLQATGRISVHDNVFVDASDAAMLLTPHEGFALKRAHVYQNTIYGGQRGVVFSGGASEGDAVLGNLIFAGTATDGPIASLGDNLTAPATSAAEYVKAPGATLGSIDFYPLAGKVAGAALDLSPFSEDAAPGCDFNGDLDARATFRGAYAGEGDNPGWALADAIKPPPNGTCSGGTGGSGSGGNANGSGGGSASGPSGAGADGTGSGLAGVGASSAGGPDGDGGGCGCRTAGGAPSGAAGAVAALVLAWGRRRRARK